MTPAQRASLGLPPIAEEKKDPVVGTPASLPPDRPAPESDPPEIPSDEVPEPADVVEDNSPTTPPPVVPIKNREHLKSLSIMDLKVHCIGRGLSPTGNIHELRKRLKLHVETEKVNV
jgi:hypothetical protein